MKAIYNKPAMDRATPTTTELITVLSPVTNAFNARTSIKVFIGKRFRVTLLFYPKYTYRNDLGTTKIDQWHLTMDRS